MKHFKLYEEFIKEGYTDLLKIAKSHPRSNTTETGAFPTTSKVPHQFLQELGIKLQDSKDYVLVVEIQFDTNKLVLQGHSSDGENYDTVTNYDIKSLSDSFQKWLIDSIAQEIKNIQTRKTAQKYKL